MTKLVVLITVHSEKTLSVAEAWHQRGAPGATIIDAHGLRRLQEKGRSLDLPMFVSMASILREIQPTSQVLLSVVDDELVDPMIEAAEAVLGNLDLPETGLMFVVDIERVIGLRRHG